MVLLDSQDPNCLNCVYARRYSGEVCHPVGVAGRWVKNGGFKERTHPLAEFWLFDRKFWGRFVTWLVLPGGGLKMVGSQTEPTLLVWLALPERRVNNGGFKERTHPTRLWVGVL